MHLKIALPNKGRLYEDTLGFLEECSLNLKRDNKRQYQSLIKGLSRDVEVIFQRALDIPRVVGQGQADLGITGLDIFCEMGKEASGCALVFPDVVREEEREIPALPFGNCVLVLAVPEEWVDITSISDLAELAIVWKKQNRMLRVATEFANLTKNYLFQKGVSYFEVIEVSGACESMPKMGGADIVSDLMSSGTTLAENRLKLIDGGEILKSQAALIASLSLQKEDKGSLKITLLKHLIDRIEAHLNAKRNYLLTTNIKRKLPDLPFAKVISLVSNDNDNMWSITMQGSSENLEEIISILRECGCGNIIVSSLNFVYDAKPKAFLSLANSHRFPL